MTADRLIAEGSAKAPPKSSPEAADVQKASGEQLDAQRKRDAHERPPGRPFSLLELLARADKVRKIRASDEEHKPQ